MKKIGIVTFHRSHNCGSILQSYATQEIVKKYGFEPEFIDFSSKGQRELYTVFRPFKFNTPRNFARSVYKNGLGALLYRRAKANWSSYDRYLLEKLSVSNMSYEVNSDLVESKMDYDVYLTGSDQVWNITIDDYDDAYFLNFVKDHPKIAYAVSQGARDLNKFAPDTGKISEYIKELDHVSVREENGQKWIQALTGKEYPVVLDPTLLHLQDVYTSIEESHNVPGIEKNKYIFIYATPLSTEYMALIRKYAKDNDLELVIWHNDIWLKRFGWLKGIKSPKAQNPGKYLDLIKNAKFVCTSSFHGVAFSTIYRKDFVVLENDGMRAGDDDRMTGFLKRLKLSDRIVNESAFEAKMNEAIDYTDFEVELKKNQKISHDFLDKALKD
ncbi:polysaccharide pyruvyl transferase family protein [Candidatus Saccharibacteria bacterium]|nr:polysaccharide pyruvyl transferase family protein [Candidatus Saccharibacteria bacterium]MBH1972998.1 polysaccharide pyruvyl transferase family protein [Candidatus Saccharibacteria bacterium]MBH1991201.1 polysaccharide pyruvyl transferase family protein [Candidatus Saccharibacteria bacterium]